MLDLLEHLPDPHAELAECRRVLKDGGLLAIRTPLVDSIYAKLKGPGWYFGLEHLAYYSIATLKRLAESEGFSVEKIYYGDEWSAAESTTEVKEGAGKKLAAFAASALRKIHLGPLHLASATIYCKKGKNSPPAAARIR
jgi:SAM-dependent methyltransferase